MIKNDFHCHTSASDGALTPHQLLERAYEFEVKRLAITDHDTTLGYEQALDLYDPNQIELISGVEISCSWNKQTIHVVALDFDVTNSVLQAGLGLNRQLRVERARTILHKLAQSPNAHLQAIVQETMPLLDDDTLVIGRGNIAQKMIEKQLVKNMPQAFDRYLKRGRIGYAKVEWPSLEEIVAWILQAGGIAVLAHPKTYPLSNNKLNQLIQAFKDAGGQAIEVINRPRMCAEQTGLIERAKRFDLYASMGSDFHRPEHHWRGLGWLTPMPENCRPVWELFKN